MSSLLPLARVAAQAFVSGLWQGLFLVAAVALILRVVPRLTPAIRFAVWGTTFLFAATIPFVHLASNTTAARTPALHVSPGWVVAIALVWAALSAFRLIRLSLNARTVRRIWMNATPIEAPTEIQAVLGTIARRPTLCLSPDVDSPSVIGFLAPRLLIPESLYPTLTPIERHQIVLHECEHLRRCDDWINLLQKFALALFPLSPALWFADRRLGLERELACDAAVVTASATPLAYARSLTRLAEHRLLHPRLALALSAWGRQSELVRRVQTLLRPSLAVSPRRARASVAILTAALSAGAFELAQAPHFISFAETATNSVAETAPVFLPAPPKALPVVFHPLTTPQPAPSLRRKSVSHPLPRPTLNTPRIIMTSAPSAPESHTPPRTARPAYLLTTDFVPSYAAVPFADGWIIIQL